MGRLGCVPHLTSLPYESQGRQAEFVTGMPVNDSMYHCAQQLDFSFWKNEILRIFDFGQKIAEKSVDKPTEVWHSIRAQEKAHTEQSNT